MGFVIAFTEFHSWGRISSLIAFAVGLVLKSGMARVPEDERLRIVELYTKEYSQRAVAAMVKRPLKTVNRIIQAFRDENRIKDAPRKPRPRVTTQEDDMNIVAYVADNPRASLSEIRQCFQLTASKTTVKRRLAEAGLKSRMAAQKPLLTNVNKSKRLSFAQRHEAWSADDWRRVVFSDECTFTTKWDQRARVWRPDRTRYVRILLSLLQFPNLATTSIVKQTVNLSFNAPKSKKSIQVSPKRRDRNSFRNYTLLIIRPLCHMRGLENMPAPEILRYLLPRMKHSISY